MYRTGLPASIDSVTGYRASQYYTVGPRSLFTHGEQGAWYDPSDFSTMFQDAAGTTPVTAVEQNVGLMLDKSKGLTLGAELVTNGDFSQGTTGWDAANVQSVVSSASGELICTAASGVTAGGSVQTLALVVGKTYLINGSCRRNSGDYVQLAVINNAQTVFVAQGQQVTNGVLTASSLFFTATETNNKLYLRVYSATQTGSSGAFDNISVREIAGNHAYQTTSASRPQLKQDANGKYYLLFDGTDDFLVTNSIDFAATDKMTVWAGVRKLSDAAIGILVELSAIVTNNGSFLISAPQSAGVGSYAFAAKITGGPYFWEPTGHNAPVSEVLSMQVSGAGGALTSTVIPRINGSLSQSGGTTGTIGIGKFGNYPLYIGRRGGTTLPFNGQIYSLIIRGAQSSDAQIIATEKYCNSKTGAY